MSGGRESPGALLLLCSSERWRTTRGQHPLFLLSELYATIYDIYGLHSLYTTMSGGKKREKMEKRINCVRDYISNDQLAGKGDVPRVFVY